MRIESEKKDQRLSLMIDATTDQRLDRLERKRKTSRSNVVRAALEFYLTREENRK